MANENKTVIVDFDGTICEDWFPAVGPPKPNVREGLQKLEDAGFTVKISSCRTNSNWGVANAVEQTLIIQGYMKHFKLPYDCVCIESKPFAAVYIDDRGVAYRGNWLEAAEEAVRLANEQGK